MRKLSILFLLLMCLQSVHAQDEMVPAPLKSHTYKPVASADDVIAGVKKDDLSAAGASLNNKVFAFIGDSQIAVTKGVMPKTVAEDLGIDIEYFGQSSANARHYLGLVKDLPNKACTNVEELKGEKCHDAFEYFTMENKPDYVIIALGHNTTVSLQELIDEFDAVGVKTILVKMFQIPKLPDFPSWYGDMHADYIVDLREYKTYARDRIHPDSDTMVEMGHHIADQLREKLSIY